MRSWFTSGSALIIACLAACAHPYAPEQFPPTLERIHQLEALASAVKAIPLPFEVRVSPAFAFAGGAVWVTCYVPERYGAGRIRLALEGIGEGERAIEGIQLKRLFENLPCGTWIASCTISTPRGVERREQPLEVKGAMCEGH